MQISLFMFANAKGQTEPQTNQQSANLIDIFQYLKIEKQVSFLFEPESIDGVTILTPFEKEWEVKYILKKILPPVGLKFRKIGNNNYVIKSSKKLIKRKKEVSTTPIIKRHDASLLKRVSGIVINIDDEESLIGATVGIRNSSIGTITNEHGEFELDVPSSTDELVVSYVGFEQKTIKIDASKKQFISLIPTATDLDEIIITAVGIAANKRMLGFATDNFDVGELHPTGEANLVSALSSKSAGVWVNTASGMPGASASINIRGLRSINGSNKPLFILDGVPVDNSTFGNGTGGVDVSNRMIDINYHDIENISILKGASATALYGIRAANGAIVMTSKKGEKGKPSINFSSSWGVNKYNKLPSRQTEYAQGRYKNGRSIYQGPETNVSSSYGPNINTLEFDGDDNYLFDKKGRLVEQGQGVGVPAQHYDVYDAFFVSGHTIDNHLSVAGGSPWFDYYFSFGQFRETGIVPGSSFDRYTVRGAFQARLHEKLALGMSSNLITSGGQRMKRGSLFSGVPLGLFRNPITFDIGNGKKRKAAADSPESYIFENGSQRSFRGNGSYDNPFWTINRNPFEDKVNRIIQSVKADYDIAPWFKASYIIGLDVYSDERKSVFDINSASHPKGQIDLFNVNATNINSDFLFTIKKQVSKHWDVEATIGHNYFSSEYSFDETRGEELSKQGDYNISNASNIQKDVNILRKKVAGIFTDIHWRYKRILYLNFTGRNDWSSTLPKQNNSFFYPGLNVGFEFTECLGWTDSPILSFGKFRFSISKVGNDARSYLTETYFNPAVINGDDLLPNVEFPAFDVSAFERSGVAGNPNLRPETTNTLELGSDLIFLKGRLRLDLAWYKSINKDQIVNSQVSAASGFLRVPTNAGTIVNQGVETTLSINPVRSKNFKWDISANFSRSKSIITELSENTSGIVLASFSTFSSMILEGQPYGVLVGTSIKRDELGRAVIDKDGFPTVNDEQTIIGDPTPDFLLGIQNDFNWKKWTLNFHLDIRKGGDIWNGTRGVMSYLGTSKITGEQRGIRDYTFEGVTEGGRPNKKSVDFANPENGMQGIYWRRYGFLGLAEQHVEDGSWVRLRELSLSYEYIPTWMKNNNSRISISIHAHNLFLITNYSGVDPETNLRGDSNILGWDYFTMPSTKGFSVQLTAHF